jgi:hypothetical protein
MVACVGWQIDMTKEKARHFMGAPVASKSAGNLNAESGSCYFILSFGEEDTQARPALWGLKLSGESSESQ